MESDLVSHREALMTDSTNRGWKALTVETPQKETGTDVTQSQDGGSAESRLHCDTARHPLGASQAVRSRNTGRLGDEEPRKAELMVPPSLGGSIRAHKAGHAGSGCTTEASETCA